MARRTMGATATPAISRSDDRTFETFGVDGAVSPGKEIVSEDYTKNIVGPQGFYNGAVKTTESQLSNAHKPFGYLLIFTRNNGTTNTDFILVGGQGTETIDLGVGDSFLFTDMIPAELWVVANSGTQAVYAIGWGKPSWE